jgi:dipeptidyl aminopeptidase/acylaminoacyl peptidase
VYYPDAGHGFDKIEHQIDAARRTVAWFDKYLEPPDATTTPSQ